jgi:N6-L-threonylcarbamoyladenine synthase
MKVLGIETSCDETSVAIVEDGRVILSNIIASSSKFHKLYGGIVPEIASRYHVEIILSLLKQALEEANVLLNDIDLIAVTQGPGLIGSLMIGISFAKSLAYCLRKPIIGIDHLLAHSYAVWLEGASLNFPYLALILSGGHSCILLMKNFDEFELIANTRDDAIGEAFDKVARLLGLGFPGGPEIEKHAKKGEKSQVNFPQTKIKENYDFSFSGLKTAVLYWLKKREKISNMEINDICWEFQEKAFDSIISQIKRITSDLNLPRIVLGGGVCANQRLRDKFLDVFSHNIKLYFPSKQLCSDNAGIVAGLGYRLYNKGRHEDFNFSAYTNFEVRYA